MIITAHYEKKNWKNVMIIKYIYNIICYSWEVILEWKIYHVRDYSRIWRSFMLENNDNVNTFKELPKKFGL